VINQGALALTATVLGSAGYYWLLRNRGEETRPAAWKAAGVGLVFGCGVYLLPILVIAAPLYAALHDAVGGGHRHKVEQRVEEEAPVSGNLRLQRAQDGQYRMSFFRSDDDISSQVFEHVRDEDDGITVAFGEVADKGEDGERIARVAAGVVRILLQQRLQPGEILRQVSRSMQDDLHAADTLLDMVVLHVDPNQQEIVIANAGHPSPLLRIEKAIEAIDIKGLVLGLVADWRYDQTTVSFPAGAEIVLYSDSLLNASQYAWDGPPALARALQQRGDVDNLTDRLLAEIPAGQKTPNVSIFSMQTGEST